MPARQLGWQAGVLRGAGPSPTFWEPSEEVLNTESPVVWQGEARAFEVLFVTASISLPASKRHKDAGPVPLGVRKEPVLALGCSSWHHLRSFLPTGPAVLAPQP